MGYQVYPQPSSGGGIKSVQRGQAVSAGNITITAVDTTKTFVRSFSEGAAGTVATNSAIASHNSSFPRTQLDQGTQFQQNAFGGSGVGGAAYTIPALSISNPSASISGGTMDATVKQMGVYLSNSTTLVATGACRWEVVEFA